jgi:hypothetical protein
MSGPPNLNFNGTAAMGGAFFGPGSSSLLFFGSIGTTTVGYGEADQFNDNYRTSKGYHAQDGKYQYQVWAYNVEDLIAVKNGQKQPWAIQPYEKWDFDFPQFDGAKYIGGVAFDSNSGRLYVSQKSGEKGQYVNKPLIHVYQVAVPSPAPEAPGRTSPVIELITANPNPVLVGGSYTITASGVTDTNPGGFVKAVEFYLDLDANGILDLGSDLSLGSGAQAGNDWTVTSSTNGLLAGNYDLFAQAADNDGNLSDMAKTMLSVL